MAIFDWVITLISIIYLNNYKVIKFMNLQRYFILLIPIIIITHKLFGIESTLVKYFNKIIS